MSMVGTLAKLAVGAMVAKGVGSVVRNGGGGSAGGLGGLLGGLSGALGGGQAGGQQQGGGLGGALGGLGALLGGAAGGNQASGGAAGGLGGLLESIGGGASQPTNAQAPAGGSLGHLLNDALGGQEPQASTAQEDQARILISAMIAGTKADGNVDQAEQQKIVEQLGNDISDDERTFVLNEMKSDLDVEALIRSIPKGAEQQAYMMSLMGMTLDNKQEAVFLDTFRKGLQVSEEVANAIHQQLGVPTLYG